MSHGSIYQSQSKELLRLFEDAGHPAKILCCALDYAKKTHVALFCDGQGEILKKPFSVKNSPEGLEYLKERVRRTCRRKGILTPHVLFGGEDGGPFSMNFIHALRQEGWLVAGINALDAKKQRENLQASSDKLDLLGVAKVLVNRRGNFDPAQTGAYLNLRYLVRYRRRMVQVKTSVSNRIHALVSQLFPGFLEESKSGIPAFSKASLWLLSERFSAQQLRRRRLPSLVQALQRQGLPKAEENARKLKTYAEQVLCAPSEYVDTLQLSLTQQVDLYNALAANIDHSEHEMAVWLAQTQGAVLSTIRGVGLVLAAGVTAELGDPNAQHPLRQIVSYAGIIPRTSQTGGPQNEPHAGSVAKRCNRILKDYTVQSACHIGQHGPEELMQDYRRRDAAGQHADFGIARRYLRAAMRMMRTGEIYLPSNLRTKNATREERIAYYLEMWPLLREKWSNARAQQAAFNSGNPLGVWRDMVEEYYAISLPLKQNSQ